MKPGNGNPAKTSIGTTTVRGGGAGSDARRISNAVTSALSQIAGEPTQRSLLAGLRHVDRLKVRVPHNASTDQIRRALVRALAKRSGFAGNDR